MNPTKTKFKIDMAEDFGRKFEGMEEEAERSFYRQEGARDALKAAAQPIGQLMANIDDEVKEGALKEIAGEPLKVAEYAKRWLKRALGSIDSLATKAEVARVAAGGQRKGLEDAKKVAFKVWEEERNKLRAYLEAVEEDKPRDDGREADGHPGPTLKSQRSTEENPLAKEPKNEPKKAPKKKATQAKKAPAKKRLRDPKKKR